jgi:hypothetical protein
MCGIPRKKSVLSASLSCFLINLRQSCCAALTLAQLLILDLDIDVGLIQDRYAKASSLSSSIELKLIPQGYI